MRHKKKPPSRARHLRGCKSGYRIVTYSNTKNNAPENKIKV